MLEYETRPIIALKDSGIDKASMVIVAHQTDSENMLTILSARKLRPDIRIVSVVHDQNLVETAKNAGSGRRDPCLGDGRSSSRTIGCDKGPRRCGLLRKDRNEGDSGILGLQIFEKLIGKGLHKVSKLAAIIGVVRDDKVVTDLFDPTFKLQENDTLLVLGDPGNLRTLEEEAKAL